MEEPSHWEMLEKNIRRRWWKGLGDLTLDIQILADIDGRVGCVAFVEICNEAVVWGGRDWVREGVNRGEGESCKEGQVG